MARAHRKGAIETLSQTLRLGDVNDGMARAHRKGAIETFNLSASDSPFTGMARAHRKGAIETQTNRRSDLRFGLPKNGARTSQRCD